MISSTFLFFFNDTATTEIYTLSLHDALPISGANDTYKHRTATGADLAARAGAGLQPPGRIAGVPATARGHRSEEHTSELQSRRDLVCRLLLEKKKKKKKKH